MFFNPFEQFITYPLFNFNFFLDFTFSNTTLCLLIILFGVIFSTFLLYDSKSNTLYALPTSLEAHIFLAYIAIQGILEKHVHVKFYQQVLFPLTFSLGIFLLFLNLSGNLPLFMSLTSQFAIISAFCLPTFFWYFFFICLRAPINISSNILCAWY